MAPRQAIVLRAQNAGLVFPPAFGYEGKGAVFGPPRLCGELKVTLMATDPMIYPVILCGGSGTRLWPASRKSYPKQFSSLTGDVSLFQASARRFSGPGFAPPIAVSADRFRFIVTEQLAALEMSPSAILIEPDGRNTAPAVLASALWLEDRAPDAFMLVAPSDHVISDGAAFQETVRAAMGRAGAGDIVTFGIHADRPETGYGYLDVDPAERQGDGPFPLRRFVEKPGAETAADMIEAGNYFWNAGIFLFSVQTILKAYRDCAPDLVKAVAPAVTGALNDLGFTRLDPEAWAQVQDISIDYAVMEKARNLSVMPYFSGWSDLGGWEAVWQESGPDDAGNVHSENVTAIDCKNTLLRSEAEGMELVAIGLEDIVAVAMPDAVLVAKKSQSQQVKDAVSAMKARKVAQSEQFPRDYRPWGWFESLAASDRFQVKRIVVKPGAALSLQSHHHRAEHWVVVAGTARVTIDGTETLLSENQSIYIPLGAVHRLENPGKVPMVLIEIQTGTYLGEDDIIRYEDLYARS